MKSFKDFFHFKRVVHLGLAILVAYLWYLEFNKPQIQTKKIEAVKIKKKSKKTKTVVTKRPDGTVRTETSVIETDTDRSSVSRTETKVILPKKTNISALVGIDTSKALPPVYGVSATHQAFGPVSVGAFGLTNGTVGLSVGITF